MPRLHSKVTAMRKPTDRQNKTESQLIQALHEKEIFDQLMPALRKIVKSGGGADAVLKRSEPLAAATLATLLLSEKDEVRRQAAKDIMERVSGKAVERSMNVYADVGRLDDKSLDSQIMRLMSQSGADKFLEQALEVKKLPKKQKRKPRKAQIIEGDVIDVTPVETKTDGPQEPQQN